MKRIRTTACCLAMLVAFACPALAQSPDPTTESVDINDPQALYDAILLTVSGVNDLASTDDASVQTCLNPYLQRLGAQQRLADGALAGALGGDSDALRVLQEAYQAARNTARTARQQCTPQAGGGAGGVGTQTSTPNLPGQDTTDLGDQTELGDGETQSTDRFVDQSPES